MGLPFLRRKGQFSKDELVRTAVQVAQRPGDLAQVPKAMRRDVEHLVKALQAASGWDDRPKTLAKASTPRPVSAAVLAARAHQLLAPSTSVTPADIALALQQQGLDWVEPFPPGTPLTPFYGYNRMPRKYDYRIGRNITTETRPDRIPFETLDHLYKSYDVAQICTRHAINSLRSLDFRFEAATGHDKWPKKEIEEVQKRLARPDGRKTLRNWLAENMLNVYKYDAAPIAKIRDKAGNIVRLVNVDGPTIAPMLDYYGEVPVPPAPAFQQFIQGVPWDWLTTDDIIYEPFWPETESPYGTPPLETVLINANTDVRLQLYFLQFFTAGSVPEAFAIAPEDMTTPDDIADFQEQYSAYFDGDQSQRWGLKWLPHGTELQFYKPQQFDPELAEYVMRRTVAAFLQVPHNLGFTDQVNKASGDTQMDVQFRVTDLPICFYYEDILNDIIQNEWGLPVKFKFDTGGDKEDRVKEAQAHYWYVQMGAESPDDVREKVLGQPVHPGERIPRFIMDQRLGLIPLSYVYAVSGEVDPETGAPKEGSWAPLPYSLPGQGAPVPAEATLAFVQQSMDQGEVQPPEGGLTTSEQVAQEVNPSKRPDPTKSYPSSHTRNPKAQQAKKTKDPDEDPLVEELGEETPDHDNVPSVSPYPEPDEHAGYGLWGHGSTAQGTGATGFPPKGVSHELAKWRSNARKRVARGSAPRRFESDVLPPEVADQVWAVLKDARTVEDVDRAFRLEARNDDLQRLLAAAEAVEQFGQQLLDRVTR